MLFVYGGGGGGGGAIIWKSVLREITSGLEMRLCARAYVHDLCGFFDMYYADFLIFFCFLCVCVCVLFCCGLVKINLIVSVFCP